MHLNQTQLANILALNIVKYEILAEGHRAANDAEQELRSHARAESLKDLVDDLGINSHYFESVYKNLKKEG